ncbi:FKBP-type peptidyl-prolyl cis-trans isomerase [Phenylobacterium soli]|uniref:Peptidyl-prolyl cis-trans isomerase n=1 Tax=Phenylobacterium soli TaxID=2170551 RepID=A0A328AEV6_9CAUL|nr:FKBP-type peptidyl-prolyl cis-trans isomerase [Phenylobacterium soli]RAK53403.1 FKBP-type peptidyl-prolyl cis-trans isomerase [Phenylobacterium soli]
MRRAILALAGVFALAGALAACHGPAKPDPAKLSQANAEAQAFMAKTAAEPGVQKLPSGLMFKVVRSGEPTGMRPQLGDEVKVNYEGKLANGKVFDSSYERGQPAAMPLKGLIPAWQEALPLMRPGDEWILYVPPNLGYGAEGAGGGEIPPNAVLIFKIELLGVLPGPGRVANG